MTTPSMKNEQFVAQLGVSADVFHQPHVVVELPPGQEARPDAAAAFILAANLLARMFADVSLVAPDVPLGVEPLEVPAPRGTARATQRTRRGDGTVGDDEAGGRGSRHRCPADIHGQAGEFRDVRRVERRARR